MIRNIYIGKTNARRYRGCIKIGKAYDTDKRWKDIDRSVKGSREWPICSGPVLFASRIEKWMHRRYDSYRVRFKGSGRTEWFKMPIYKRWEALCIVWACTGLTWAILITLAYCVLKTLV